MSDVTEHEDDQTTILTDENRQNDPDDDVTEEEAGLTELQVNIEEATRRFNERFPPTELRGNVTTRRSEGYVDPLTSMAEDVISLPAVSDSSQLTPYVSGARSVDTPVRTPAVAPITRPVSRTARSLILLTSTQVMLVPRNVLLQLKQGRNRVVVQRR